MTNSTLSLLDQGELLQLAINASETGDAASAIAYLKEAAGRADASAATHYLLGAEYAQSKLYPRAIDQMEAALALDPALHTARLQLGLLWLGAAQGDRSLAVLAPLEELPAGEALHHFGLGLRYLIGDQMAQATASLQQGVELNTGNQALNSDMQKIIGGIAALATAAAEAPPAVEEHAGHHILLSAYMGNESHGPR